MYDCNVLYSILLTHSMSVLSTDVSTAQYLRSLLSTDISTVQYLHNKYWVSKNLQYVNNEKDMYCTWESIDTDHRPQTTDDDTL